MNLNPPLDLIQILHLCSATAFAYEYNPAAKHSFIRHYLFGLCVRFSKYLLIYPRRRIHPGGIRIVRHIHSDCECGQLFRKPGHAGLYL